MIIGERVIWDKWVYPVYSIYLFGFAQPADSGRCGDVVPRVFGVRHRKCCLGIKVVSRGSREARLGNTDLTEVDMLYSMTFLHGNGIVMSSIHLFLEHETFMDR